EAIKGVQALHARGTITIVATRPFRRSVRQVVCRVRLGLVVVVRATGDSQRKREEYPDEREPVSTALPCGRWSVEHRGPPGPVTRRIGRDLSDVPWPRAGRTSRARVGPRLRGREGDEAAGHRAGLGSCEGFVHAIERQAL